MQIAFAMPTKIPPKYCVVFVKMKLKIKFNLFASVRYTTNFVRNTSTGINLQTEQSFTLLMQCHEKNSRQNFPFFVVVFHACKKRDIYVLLKQTGYSPTIPVGSNVQRGMWPCVTTCYKEDRLSLIHI